MAQARKEPRFAAMELLAPVKAAGSSARLALVDADISDADFETLCPPVTKPEPSEDRPAASSISAPGLGLLKQRTLSGVAAFAFDEPLSPGFVGLTLILALFVFWLCGGHALLY